MRVLLVEDDRSIAKPLVDGLARYGIQTDHVATGAAALAAAPPDLVVLDAELPGLDAYRRLRRAGGPPLIMLTRDGAGSDRAHGFDADDYLPKPFSVLDLVNRLRAVDRRSRPGGEPVLVRGPLTVDTLRHEVRVHRIPVPLSPKEFDLLALLAAAPGAVVTRRYLLERVWGADFSGGGKTLDFHVASLRRKLGDSGWIENRRGVGFRLAIPA